MTGFLAHSFTDDNAWSFWLAVLSLPVTINMAIMSALSVTPESSLSFCFLGKTTLHVYTTFTPSVNTSMQIAQVTLRFGLECKLSKC